VVGVVKFDLIINYLSNRFYVCGEVGCKAINSFKIRLAAISRFNSSYSINSLHDSLAIKSIIFLRLCSLMKERRQTDKPDNETRKGQPEKRKQKRTKEKNRRDTEKQEERQSNKQ
jgi:hypothetical protein